MGLLSGVTIDKLDLGGIFTGAGTFLQDVRSVFTGKTVLDANKAAELNQKANELEISLMKAQTDINLIEAASPKLFVSGWRPFVGWICGLGLAMEYIIFPFASWTLAIIGHPEIKLPTLSVSELYPLLFGLLGFGAYRGIEKIKGVARN